jgi:hypothetical protein
MARHARSVRPPACTCDECAELDLAFPGKGTQLALPLRDLGPRPRRPSAPDRPELSRTQFERPRGARQQEPKPSRRTPAPALEA